MMEKYSSWASVPEHLKTKTQLGKLGKKPAKGQRPIAKKTGGKGPFALYDVAEAVEKRSPSPAQLEALAKARAAAEAANRCADCGLVFVRRGRYSWAEERSDGRKICVDCVNRRRASAWARRFLADPTNVILDTETTGLDDEAEIVEIAVINVAGETLVNTLVQPTRPIPWDAEAIHGISNEEVATTPTWVVIEPEVRQALAGAGQVAIYNAVYDLRLLGQSSRAYGLDPEPWLSELLQKSVCAMDEYAEYVGEWSSYHGNYRWQPLNGGHRALGDCQATLEVIKKMAASDFDQREH